jgi:hypothetical protein
VIRVTFSREGEGGEVVHFGTVVSVGAFVLLDGKRIAQRASVPAGPPSTREVETWVDEHGVHWSTLSVAIDAAIDAREVRWK